MAIPFHKWVFSRLHTTYLRYIYIYIIIGIETTTEVIVAWRTDCKARGRDNRYATRNRSQSISDLPLFDHMKLQTLGSYSLANARPTARSRDVSKLRDSGLDFFHRFEIWLAPRQRLVLPSCLSNFRSIWFLNRLITRLRDFMIFVGKTPYGLVNRGPVSY